MIEPQRSVDYYRPVPDYSPLPPGTNDDLLVEIWLHDLAPRTQQSYRIDIKAFFAFVRCSLHQVNLADLQGFADSLKAKGYQPATITRRLRAVKSLLSFATRTKYLPYDIGAAVRTKKVPRSLHQRILSVEEVIKLFLAEQNERNRLILRLLYYSAARVSELCDFCWRDLYRSGDKGVIAIFGKGSKQRYVSLKSEVFDEILAFRGDAADDDPVFLSRGGGRNRKKSGGHLSKSQVEYIVAQAAVKAGLKKRVTPHYLRHSHATHAMLNHAPAAVIQQTLGHESIETTMLYFDISPEESSSFFLKI